VGSNFFKKVEEAIKELFKFNSLIETRGMHSVPERKY